MQKVKLISALMLALAMSFTNGEISANQQSKKESKMEQEQT